MAELADLAARNDWHWNEKFYGRNNDSIYLNNERYAADASFATLYYEARRLHKAQQDVEVSICIKTADGTTHTVTANSAGIIAACRQLGMSIGDGCKFAEQCDIHADATIGSNNVFGRRTNVGQNAIIGDDNQFAGDDTHIIGTVGNRGRFGMGVSIHEQATVHDDVVIGSRVFAKRGCTIGENVRIGNHVTIAEDVVLYYGSVVGDSSSIRNNGCLTKAEHEKKYPR